MDRERRTTTKVITPGTYYSRNREKALAVTRAYYRNNRAVMLWHNAKNRAKRKGIEFDIAVSDVVLPDVCPVFLTPMDRPSIDRFDSAKGYTKDNIRVISYRANVLKKDATVAEVEALLRYMRG